MGKFFGAKNSYESVNVNKKGDSEDTNKDHATFGFWTGVAFTVNYIMGCGFLSLPSAFYKTVRTFANLPRGSHISSITRIAGHGVRTAHGHLVRLYHECFQRLHVGDDGTS